MKMYLAYVDDIYFDCSFELSHAIEAIGRHHRVTGEFTIILCECGSRIDPPDQGRLIFRGSKAEAGAIAWN